VELELDTPTIAREVPIKNKRRAGISATNQVKAHLYDKGLQVTQQIFTANNYINYTYDKIGQLKMARGWESDDVTPRLQEQFGYAYDAAWNLNQRTNNALIQSFAVNTLNELTIATNRGTLTVAGTTTEGDSNYVNNGVFSVTVNGQAASVYFDGTFAAPGFTPANGNNTFKAIAQDGYGRFDTNSVTVYLPATNTYSYDLNGNLLTDGTRHFTYDDENQLVSVWVANTWSNNFMYDGLLRKRIERDYAWNGSSWVKTNEVRFVYDDNLVIQERDINNLPQVTYTRGNDLSGTMQGAGGIGGLLARTDMGQWIIGSPTAHAYYHADGNGNITMLINGYQAIVAKYLYDPYGNTLSLGGSLASANKFRFSSKEWNDNAGLYYYLYRYYDPNLQRWPNRDPITELGFALLMSPNVTASDDGSTFSTGVVREDEGDVNLYSFVVNEPILLVDTYGCLPPGKWWPWNWHWKKIRKLFPPYQLPKPFPPGSTCSPTWSPKGFEIVIPLGGPGTPPSTGPSLPLPQNPSQ
jgi:RHS repeat-associated protein